MTRHLAVLAVVLAVLGLQNSHAEMVGNDLFDEYFVDRTLRVDYYHGGNSENETISLAQLVEEPVWAGPRRNLTHPLEFGSYRVSIHDADGETLLYTSGFSSLFGEWRTTGEAADGPPRALEESVRVPLARQPIVLRLAKRHAESSFETIFELTVDPASPSLSRERKFKDFEVFHAHGDAPPEQALDILFVGDGYSAQEMKKYRADVMRFTRTLLATPPFKDLSHKINVRAVEAISRDSGIDEPLKGIYRDTIAGCSFNTFGTPRYLTTTKDRALREVAARAPYDTLCVIVNTSRYGGGGIYNFFTIMVSDNPFDDYVWIHELGHGLAGLGDEYYTSQVAYNEFYPPGVEPWEPNITALLDPPNVKWIDLVSTDTPLPTVNGEPTAAQRRRYAGRVGAFEGAGYAAKNLFRPSLDCKMFSKRESPFCDVCSRAIEQTILYHAGEDYSE